MRFGFEPRQRSLAMGERPANDDKIQTGGREANAAQPLNASDNEQGPERYPPVRQDDAVETGETARSFDTGSNNPEPRQGAGDTTTPSSTNDGRLGPGGDPAEGKP
jgi:hypothetical protein